LPQMTYYAWAAIQLAHKETQFIVPSGNMGNITAGLFAKQMGVPINSFVIACNANDPVVRYYESGQYRAKPAIRTLSNAMDIGNPSNFERILDLYNNNHKTFKKDVSAFSISDAETI